MCNLPTNDSTALVTLRWRHLNVCFTILHKDEIDDFHDHLNEQNADIQCTKEMEENGKFPFLDCLVSRQFTETRPISTDYLTNHPTVTRLHTKPTTIKTLTRRAQPVCDTSESLRGENRYLEHVLTKTVTYATLTLLDETFTDLLKLTLQTGTQHLLLQ